MDKLHSVINYLNYRRLRTNEHGIHSPFVFDLYRYVFRNENPYYGYEKIEALRDSLSRNNTKIEVNDLGAGSGSGSTNLRTVNSILSTASKPLKYSRLLFRLADYFSANTILELGTNLGISSASLAIARPKSRIITIEGSTEIHHLAISNFKSLGLANIQAICGNFDTELPKILAVENQLDFVFFDGNHRKEPTLSYFHQCLQKVHNESVFIFDDIYWSREMTEAWTAIKNHPKVTVTIDIFQMGIVFFRKEQVKQHFILSY
ncbi:MAG: SAM-dependent methyltransferase [Bacteroidota bacterium]|jgi:predicted O-methyltransferase YrrM|nr:SAM-dependent methyltransferase [Bacteroidota bacterium]